MAAFIFISHKSHILLALGSGLAVIRRLLMFNYSSIFTFPVLTQPAVQKTINQTKKTLLLGGIKANLASWKTSPSNSTLKCSGFSKANKICYYFSLLERKCVISLALNSTPRPHVAVKESIRVVFRENPKKPKNTKNLLGL